MATAWSFSRYEVHSECPLKYKFRYILKMEEPKGAALERGEAVHNMIAQYLTGEIDGPVPGWTYFENLFRQLKELDPVVEQEWAYTEEWEPTGWFARDAWLRAKLDAFLAYVDHTSDVVDFKTGKFRPAAQQQAEVYALTVFSRYPVNSTNVRFWYLDSGQEKEFTFTRKDFKKLRRKWANRAEVMLTDEVHAPRPGEHCKWCNWSRSSGGPCRFG